MVDTRVYMYAYLCVYMWKPGKDAGHLLHCLTESGTYYFDRLVGQQTPRIHLSLPSSNIEVIGMCAYAVFVLGGPACLYTPVLSMPSFLQDCLEFKRRLSHLHSKCSSYPLSLPSLQCLSPIFNFEEPPKCFS